MKLKLMYLLSLPLFAFLITSCNKAEDVTVDDFINTSIITINESCMGGEAGCFEIVFPVTIEFADGTTSTVASYDEMKTAFRTWKSNNPDLKGRPTIVFPFDVLTQDGEIVTITSQSEIRALLVACKGTFDGPGRPGHGGTRPGHGGHGTEPCFTINFPISLDFPDGTTVEVTDRANLKSSIRQWKMDNPDATERPSISFPITVTMQDSTIVTVNSIEELKALKEDCRG